VSPPTAWLVDKSALIRLPTSPDAATWAERIERGLVHVTSLTLLEIGFSARSPDKRLILIHDPPVGDMPIDYLTPPIEDRAVEVQGLLADLGHHRAPSVPDLLLAATAEFGKLTILHVDKDFDLIAGVTGQPVERLALA
jgi:predicted nucleic acid-binding protein